MNIWHDYLHIFFMSLSLLKLIKLYGICCCPSSFQNRHLYLEMLWCKFECVSIKNNNCFNFRNFTSVFPTSSHDGKYIVAGSENQCIYIWKTHHDCSKFPSARRDRNEYWEGVKGIYFNLLGTILGVWKTATSKFNSLHVEKFMTKTFLFRNCDIYELVVESLTF